MALGNPYELESEVVKMLIRWDVVSLQCAYGIIKLDVPESKKGKQHFLFYNLMNHLCSEEGEAKEDGSIQIFKKLYRFLSKYFKMPDPIPMSESLQKFICRCKTTFR